jgi:transketolase
MAIDQRCIDTIRTLSMDAVQKANSGHPVTPMALAPIAHLLYGRVMKHAPSQPEWIDRDRFVLSAGHASMLLYSALYLSGYGLTLDDIKNFRQLHSPTAGHPEYKYADGIETTTGPLGQGISTAVGIALAERMQAARFNRPGHELIDHFTYVIASDGDLQEGVQSEACSLAGHLGLGRLIAFYDDNHITIEGEADLAFSEDVPKRFEAYGWHVQDLGEDIDLDSLARAVDAAQMVTDRPSLIVVRTHIAPGAPNKQDTPEAHGSPLGEEEIRLTKEAYGWPADEQFLVPDDVLEHYAQVKQRGAEAHAEWQQRFDAYRAEFPELADELERHFTRTPPSGWDASPPRKTEGAVATRKASSEAIQWAAAGIPDLVGGSADLGPSTLTLIKDTGYVSRDDHAGRNIAFGIREHGMGAIVNGLTLSGFRGYGATFLIFSDYMKASIRLAALMQLPSIFVFTHDSIGLGEDGPTHQPIEQLAALRATPNLDVVRPADFNETVLGWQHALNETRRPTAFALSRQNLPVLDPEAIPGDAIARGAYVLRDAENSEPEVILIGTGSEVHLCLEAAALLERDGVATRVVSMPCMDRFAEADEAYREEVLPAAVRARVAVEAASALGWHRWVGEEGDVVAMESFGHSGPYQQVYEHFGFTAEAIAERARRVAGASARA